MSKWRWENLNEGAGVFCRLEYVSQVDAVQIAAEEAGNCAAFILSGFEYKDLSRMDFS